MIICMYIKYELYILILYKVYIFEDIRQDWSELFRAGLFKTKG